MPHLSRLERDAARLLVAIMRLTKGRAGVTVLRSEVLAEAERVNLFEMSDDLFEAYKRMVEAEIADTRRKLH